MLRSLYSGVSGLKAHQTKMDVIGNNIANVNTTAFKSSRVTFKDVYYQTLKDASASSDIGGGTNPRQIGYGSAVSSIDIKTTNGGFQTTDRPLDLYLSGDGFFILSDGNGFSNYTRAGNFTFDSKGALIDSNGYYVNGWNPAYGYSASEKVSPIVVDNINDYVNVSISADGLITGVYAGKAPAHTPNSYENLGSVIASGINGYTNLKFENGKITGDNSTTDVTGADLFSNVTINSDGSVTATNIASGESEVIGNLSGIVSNPADYSDYTISNDGTVKAMFKGHFPNVAEKLGSINGASLSVPGYKDVKYLDGTITGNDETSGDTVTLYTNVKMNENGTFTGDDAIASTTGVNIPSMSLDNLVSDTSVYSELTLAADGTVTGVYNSVQVPEHITDEIEILGQIGLANFANVSGLKQSSGIYFNESKNSGAALVTTPGSNGSATIVSGALEMSNVDLATELTDMITTERGYQSNSRVITVSDEMLEELVNLKR